ncbi:MAG TPA: glycosyltransferase [Gemmataceae bacterium]|nr:glycosyltransferase [Gemmataceae bacterium]
MNAFISPGLELAPAERKNRNGELRHALEEAERLPAVPVPREYDPELLRRIAWDIGQRKAAEAYTPSACHVALAMVSPYQGFVHWRLLPEWIEQTARQRGDAWHHCRMVVRLYDVSFIEFNGLNAHHIFDIEIPTLAGHCFFNLPRPGTWQLAEVGFRLRSGEFLPAARSHVVPFASDAVSPRSSHAALLVDEHGHVEEVGNLWEQEQILQERRRPKLRQPLRIAAFALESLPTGHDGPLARFVSELAAGQRAQGHEVWVFVPANDRLPSPREIDGVRYEPLMVAPSDSPVAQAIDFGHAAERRLHELPPFDLLHHHEWGTAVVPWLGTRPTVLSLGSIEAVRRNGREPTPLSREIQQCEREAAHAVDCILTPDWLRDQAVAELGIDGALVHPFPMEARLPNEWERPLDYGQVKMGIGLGPLDRMMLFVGPLEHAAGPDLLIEALPTLLRRTSNLRLVFVGAGEMHGHLEHRAHELGVAHAVRLLGHVEGPAVTRLVRSAEAVVLPSRYRIAWDDAVVDLARRAGRPVVTTHGGPAYLVRHEENGLVTYDNPGSMVWALDRILSDPAHAEEMGRNGRRTDSSFVSWSEVARLYLDLCANCFPELRENSGR